jgi:hypothetical protein
MNRILIGIFAAVILRACRLVLWEIPHNSKIIVPLRITDTQRSGLPLPDPIRVSGGRLVI